MSRYVSIELTTRSRAQLLAAIAALGLQPEFVEGELLMLEGSLECSGEPVELRFAPGEMGAIEDFGFVRGDDGRYQLVCGEVDRGLLERRLLGPLRQHLAVKLAVEVASELGLPVSVEGEARVIVRDKS